MMGNESKYIMHPDSFEKLKNVSGFIKLNGNNYQEHICIILNKYLSIDQKKYIREKKNIYEALAYLKTIINFTHEFHPS